MSDSAECRGCKLQLIGKPYHLSTGAAYHPLTREQVTVSFWGGYVCSDGCERRVDRDMKQSIDEHADPLHWYPQA